MKKPKTAKEIFDAIFRGFPNFVTPEILKYGRTGKFVYELSEGERFNLRGRMWGVTVIEILKTKTKHRYDLSKYFLEKEIAQKYIKNLNKNNP